MSSNIYNPLVPQFGNNSLAESQPEILQNFTSLFEVFGVNHVDLDAGSTAGNHTVVELLEQTLTPETNVGNISVYSKFAEDQTEQVFLRFQGNGQELQFNTYQIYPLKQSATRTAFFTFLPGRVLLYFGSFTTLKKNTLTLYPPIAKKLFPVCLCPIGSSPTYPPKLTIPAADEDGYYSKIILRIPTNFTPATNPVENCYYLIMANI